MKKLIYQDERAIQKEIELRNTLNDLINDFLFSVEKKGLNPTKEHLKGFIEFGIPFVHEILLDDAEKEIKRLKINSVSIQNNMLAGIERQADEFKNIHSNILAQINNCGGITIDEISFEQNKAILTNSDIEQIKEHNSIFIENEKQEKIWNLQVEFAEAFNKFEVGLSEIGQKSVFHYGKPEKLEDFLLFKLGDGIKLSESEMEKISGFPRSGGVKIEANPHILR